MIRFREDLLRSYTFQCPSFRLGTAILDGNVLLDATVSVPLCTFNRHGLIAGATGTGKTKTLQLLAENLSDHGVPVLLLDIKGDLSGLGHAGTLNEKIVQRYEKMTTTEKWVPKGYPVEFLTISQEKGVRLRTTIKEFGAMLLAKIMDLNETQSSVISVIFQYCQDQNLPLITLKDFLTIVQYISNDGREEIERTYGKIAPASLGIIVRKTMELQQESVDRFFGEPAFDIRDFFANDSSLDDRGKIFILRVTDIQEKNKLFSTVMLSLLRKLYQSMPEIGDTDKPKLVMFIDEAHLLFQQTIEPLRQQIETTIKLIRSKGVGILFSTQNPTDLPGSILAQLGMKIQHALRATTGNDELFPRCRTCSSFSERSEKSQTKCGKFPLERILSRRSITHAIEYRRGVRDVSQSKRSTYDAVRLDLNCSRFDDDVLGPSA